MMKRIHDVFISYRSKDRDAVLDIRRRLKRAKLKAWLAKARLAGGDDFSDEIDAAIQRSRAVAVLVGPKGIGPWQKKEIACAAEDNGIRRIPVLLPRLRRIPRLPIVLAGLHRIDLRKGIDKLGVGQLIDAIKGKAPKPAPENKPAPRRKKARPSKASPGEQTRTPPQKGAAIRQGACRRRRRHHQRQYCGGDQQGRQHRQW